MDVSAGVGTQARRRKIRDDNQEAIVGGVKGGGVEGKKRFGSMMVLQNPSKDSVEKQDTSVFPPKTPRQKKRKGPTPATGFQLYKSLKKEVDR